MPRRAATTFQRALALALAAGAAAIGALFWERRLEWVQVPWLWSEVRRLEALREVGAEHPAFQPTEDRGLSPFDVALSRLVRLQRPGFLGGRDFVLARVRSGEGRAAILARYDPLRVAFDAPVEPDEPEIVSFCCPCELQGVLALDPRGRVLGEPEVLEVFLVDGRSTEIVPGLGGGPDVLRASAHGSCPRCAPGSWSASWRELSVDRDGLVPRGLVTADGLAAPVCSAREPRKRREPIDLALLDRLLASPRAGDLHRALSLLEESERTWCGLAEPLLAHPDAFVRARAAAVLGRDQRLGAAARPLLADPDPRVRFAAIEAVSGSPGWEGAVLPSARDLDPRVAARAHRDLVHAKDGDAAGPSALWLLARREPYVARVRFCRFATPEVLDAVAAWFEEASGEEWAADLLDFQLASAFRPEVLRPFAGRLARAYEHRLACYGWALGLAGALVRLDEPWIDELLLRRLVDEGHGGEHGGPCVLEALLRRGTPSAAPGAAASLSAFLRSGLACSMGGRNDCQVAAALLLARLGAPEGPRWLLARLEAAGDGPLWDALWEMLPRAPRGLVPEVAALLRREPEDHAERTADLLRRWATPGDEPLDCDAEADLNLPDLEFEEVEAVASAGL